VFQNTVGDLSGRTTECDAFVHDVVDLSGHVCRVPVDRRTEIDRVEQPRTNVFEHDLRRALK
jgi:hypothetical protein